MGLSVGFLGYGFMGTAHANALARLPMFFPDAPPVKRQILIGRDETALAANAERLGFTETATDWDTAIDQIDVLYNLGPNYLHAEPSITALERDVHVLCEKPLAHTIGAARDMTEAARSSNAIAGVAFNYRFVPAIAYAKALINDGALGEIRAFRGRFLQDWLVDPDESWSWRTDRELAGSGSLGDLGSHSIDLAHFLLADRVGEIDRVNGHLRTFVDERPVPDSDQTRKVTVDDAFSAQVAFEDDAMGTLEASRVAPGHKNDHTIAINGDKGSLRFSLERLNELDVLLAGDRGYETVLVTDESDPYVGAWWPPGHVLGWEHTFVHENYEFLSTIEEGGCFRPGFKDGLTVQRVLDAIDKSNRIEEWVDVRTGSGT